jgi:Fe-S-cluster formation regulator IscX/YfhJ
MAAMPLDPTPITNPTALTSAPPVVAVACGWDALSWQDLRAIGAILAERHAGEDYRTMPAEQLADLVHDLAECAALQHPPDDFILSAIASAWLYAAEGGEDRSQDDGRA